MTKFNQSTKGKSKTVNHEGAPAYKLSAEMELYATAVTTMLSDKFYEGSKDTLKRLQKLIKEVKPEFVAKLAVYAREQMYLRSLPLVLTTELAKIHNGDDLVSRTTKRVVARADEITELLAYYAQANGTKGIKKLGKLSKQVQKGLSDAFNKFDEYAFGKYNRDGEIKLRDALFLVHPKAKDAKQQELFNKIASDELATPDTWEVELSASKDKKASWERLIDENKLGYMALMRNLRNILDAKVSSDHIEKVAAKLSSAEEVAKSKQFPFRFFSAYREIEGNSSADVSIILDALEEAMVASAENIAGFDENTKVIISSDVSGSMQSPVSAKSKVQMYDIGLTLSMLLQHRSKKVISSIFGTTFAVKNFPKKNILANVSRMRNLASEVGMATNGHLILQHLIDTKEVVDKVMVFTDCQLYDSTAGAWGGQLNAQNNMKKLWKQYKEMAPNAKMYLFDLQGYGTTPLSVASGDVYLIAGWSDKVFGMLEAYEKGSNAVAEINKIEI